MTIVYATYSSLYGYKDALDKYGPGEDKNHLFKKTCTFCKRKIYVVILL